MAVPEENPQELARQDVEESVEFLDDVMGMGWERHINVERLEMSMCSMCVLGQLFNDFVMGLERLSEKSEYNTTYLKNRLGFEVNGRYEYIHLQKAWMEYLS